MPPGTLPSPRLRGPQESKGPASAPQDVAAATDTAGNPAGDSSGTDALAAASPNFQDTAEARKTNLIGRLSFRQHYIKTDIHDLCRALSA